MLVVAILISLFLGKEGQAKSKCPLTQVSVQAVLTGLSGTLIFKPDPQTKDVHAEGVIDWDAIGAAFELTFCDRLVVKAEAAYGGTTLPSMQMPVTAGVFYKAGRSSWGLNTLLVFDPRASGPASLANLVVGPGVEVELTRDVSLGVLLGYMREVPATGHPLNGVTIFTTLSYQIWGWERRPQRHH